jgi:hypothetical protein
MYAREPYRWPQAYRFSGKHEDFVKGFRNITPKGKFAPEDRTLVVNWTSVPNRFELALLSTLLYENPQIEEMIVVGCQTEEDVKLFWVKLEHAFKDIAYPELFQGKILGHIPFLPQHPDLKTPDDFKNHKCNQAAVKTRRWKESLN